MKARKQLDEPDCQMAEIRGLVCQAKRIGLGARIDPRVAERLFKRCEAAALRKVGL